MEWQEKWDRAVETVAALGTEDAPLFDVPELARLFGTDEATIRAAVSDARSRKARKVGKARA